MFEWCDRIWENDTNTNRGIFVFHVVFIGTMRVGARNLGNRRYYVKLIEQLIWLVEH